MTRRGVWPGGSSSRYAVGRSALTTTTSAGMRSPDDVMTARARPPDTSMRLTVVRVPERHAVVDRRRGQRARHGVHAALGEVDARDAVHVGDHRVDRERLGGRQPGVHRLEGEQPAQPLVARRSSPTLRSSLRNPPIATSRASGGRTSCSGESRLRSMKCGISIAYSARRYATNRSYPAASDAPQVCRISSRHRRRVGADVDGRAVGEAGAVRRVEAVQGQPVGHLLADRVQRLGEQVRHRQHGRARCRSGSRGPAGTRRDRREPRAARRP